MWLHSWSLPSQKVHIELNPGAKPVWLHLPCSSHTPTHFWKGTWSHGWNWYSQTMWGIQMGVSSFHHSWKRWTGMTNQWLMSINKAIICKQYPLSIITDVFNRISGYKFFTKLDISMQYYTFELDKPSQGLCIIVTLFGIKTTPMGLKYAPDFAQQVIEKVLCNVDNTGVYFGNIDAISFTWESTGQNSVFVKSQWLNPQPTQA